MLEPIGNVPPAEAEAAYYAALDQIAQAAQLNQSASGKPGAVQTAKHQRTKPEAMMSSLPGASVSEP